jgi:hypothetical protein
MATTNQHQQASVGARGEGRARVTGDDGQPVAARVTTGQVWDKLAKELAWLLPAGRRASACLIEAVPEGAFVTYGLGVSLSKMRSPAAARARVPMTLARSGR